MEQDITFLLVYYADLIISIIMPLATLVFGFIIAFNKVRSTRTLGLNFIFVSVNALISSVLHVTMHIMSEVDLSRSTLPLNITISICSLAATLFLCMFFHKNYGKKLYLPIFLIAILGWLADRIVTVVMAKQMDPSKPDILWVNLISVVDSFMISAAIAVVVIIVFAKNRDKEKVIPQAWLVRLIVLIWGFLHITALCFVYNSVIDSGKYIVSTDMGYMFLRIADSTSLIIFPLYVLASVLGSSKKMTNGDDSVLSR